MRGTEAGCISTVDAARKAYPRKVVAFSYVQRIATDWFRDGGHLLKEHENQ